MAYLRKNYYTDKKDIPPGEARFLSGFQIFEQHILLGRLKGDIYIKKAHLSSGESAACVTKYGDVYVNTQAKLSPGQWAYVIAHCLLHLAFGHFDAQNMPFPGEEDFSPQVWNKACDLYITRFLADIQFGDSVFEEPRNEYTIRLNDERKIYSHLLETEGETIRQTYGTNSPRRGDMIDLEHPLYYKSGESNTYAAAFSYAITHSVTSVVSDAGGHGINPGKDTPVKKAAQWFLAHYPLLGGMASSFKIIEEWEICKRYEIHIAAVDPVLGEIYANPACGFSEEEWKFVLAHEYLHAGLEHHKRCQGRDPYLWNIACDYVINGWLMEMKIGAMPREGLLYDKELKNLSAESIYDKIVKEMRKFKKHATFRGYGHGDIFGNGTPRFENADKGVSLDEFLKNALKEGLDFHITNQRGYLPAGLVEEIRALSTPPIPWEVELAKWFDHMFPPMEKHRSYARPSRRQGATPDIPRPSYAFLEKDLESRTFGVVLDTSGSMSQKQLGLALGAIASYAVSKDVPFVRVVFCDADATDAGYMSPDEIAGRVKVTGRGGTVLQPGIDLLEKAKDFPGKGPVLIITDGYIEDNLKVKREHAFLIPKGNRLPFRPVGKVFYFQK